MIDSNEGGTKQSDGVKPRERVSPGVRFGRRESDTYVSQAVDIAGIIGAKQPALLWALMLVIVVEGAQLWESGGRTAAIREWQREQSAFLMVIEEHRKEENRRMQETNKHLAQSLSRRADRVSRAATAPKAELQQ